MDYGIGSDSIFSPSKAELAEADALACVPVDVAYLEAMTPAVGTRGQATGVVDRKAKIIRGYSVMTIGEARGHNFEIDSTTLEQIITLGNASPLGIKTRVHHPRGGSDGFGKMLGWSRNFRLDGDRVIADLHLSDVAFHSPSGDLGTYLMTMAEEAPQAFGASAEIGWNPEARPGRLPVARVVALRAIAIVDDPAANQGFI